ncbi:putative Kinase-like domain-containing protein [Seiridium cardinale]|uniref:Kinase-like domain-containing protein n=1 Tax=Seiridium cardinale TaxID=138064 RepID=A0ABR2XZ06_9PEZI
MSKGVESQVSDLDPGIFSVAPNNLFLTVTDTGKGFYVWKKDGDDNSRELVPFDHEFHICSGTTLTVGRNSTPKINSICLNHRGINRVQFELYSVVYDSEGEIAPMVYVNDRSTAGIKVNGKPIGLETGTARPPLLLNNGDEIQIFPYWKFTVHLSGLQHSSLPLVPAQEADLFCDRYKIFDRVLGGGGQGRVHLALDVRRNRQLVCKIFDLDHWRKLGKNTAHENFQRNLREVDTLAKLSHPGILTFEYAFRSERKVFLFTELAAGGDLHSKIHSENPPGEEEMKFIMHELVRTIKYLHNKLDLVHRDVKPENIFFASGPHTRTRVFLGDLGCAKATTWGRMNSNVGTSIYKAPEVHVKRQPIGNYGKEIDIWSLGITLLYAMVSQEHLDIDSLSRMSQEDIDQQLYLMFDRSLLRSTFSVQAQDFVRQCLKINPNERMTASQARCHEWIRVGKRTLNEWTELRDSLWRKEHKINPPMELLPDLLYETRVQQPETTPTTTGPDPTDLERKRPVECLDQYFGLEESPFFPSSKPEASADTKASKKAKTAAGHSTAS